MFYDDVIESLPICVDLVSNFEQIKKEVVAFCQRQDSLVDYPNYPIEGYDRIYSNYWKAAPMSRFEDEHVELNGTLELKALLKQLTDNGRHHCPTVTRTISKLENEGNLANAFISRLMPGTIINPHVGWSENWMRVHLGLVCDPDCKITVGFETRTWEEGKLLAFMDGGLWQHSVKHEGKTERIVLSVDIRISYIAETLNCFGYNAILR
jgi:hypothetical protein